MICAEVEDTSDIIASLAAAVFRILAKGENLRPYCESIGYTSLHQPSYLIKVLVSLSGIDPVTATTIGRPRPPALLKPDREKERYMASPKASIGIAHRNVHDRKNSDLRRGVIFMEESVLYTNFCISKTICGRTAVWMDIHEWDKNMQLNIGNNTIVELKMRQGPFLPVLVVGILRGDIELPVKMFNWFRVIGDERWTCPSSRRPENS